MTTRILHEWVTKIRRRKERLLLSLVFLPGLLFAFEPPYVPINVSPDGSQPWTTRPRNCGPSTAQRKERNDLTFSERGKNGLSGSTATRWMQAPFYIKRSVGYLVPARHADACGLRPSFPFTSLSSYRFSFSFQFIRASPSWTLRNRSADTWNLVEPQPCSL